MTTPVKPEQPRAEADDWEDCHVCGFAGPDVHNHICVDCEQREEWEVRHASK